MMQRTFAMRVKWQHSWNQASVSKCKDSKDFITKIQDQLPVAEVFCWRLAFNLFLTLNTHNYNVFAIIMYSFLECTQRNIDY
jgi:hypothetical protein